MTLRFKQRIMMTVQSKAGNPDDLTHVPVPGEPDFDTPEEAEARVRELSEASPSEVFCVEEVDPRA